MDRTDLGNEVIAAVCGVLVVVGHCFSIFYHLKAARGSYCSRCDSVLDAPDFLVLLAVMILAVLLTRYVSLGSVLAAALLPVLCLILVEPWSYTVMSLLLAALVLFRHHSNIKRLISGQEARITDKAV